MTGLPGSVGSIGSLTINGILPGTSKGAALPEDAAAAEVERRGPVAWIEEVYSFNLEVLC